MRKKDVFAVEKVLPVHGDTWRVSGRTYEDLKVGDMVTVIDGSKGPVIKGSSQFIITAISTYGKKVRELNRMLTGDLILRGANGERLKKAGTLVMLLYPSRNKDNTEMMNEEPLT
ncbi:MAG: hypothetical protein O7E52_21060 [Candidatus Poribacteria bacterium]|nr:hypothetical protein [Candidatus Poribacteria bacterium]